MNRDPFYQAIIARLQGQLDPYIFESCAADILRKIYPTLVPIRGGDDAGMDGAVADTQGEPFPLISTTSKDVIGNLTRNLNSYMNRGGNRRKAILATSQSLTPRRRENLFIRASELGFTLINIHDQDAIANLLYRSQEWCRELLNLVGNPSALSAVPRTTRPQFANTLIARENALSWLNEIKTDSLIVGQPGSGKTSLMQTLVDNGHALFVISKNRGELVAALRKYEEKIILIVDDAHLYHNIIPDLLHIRSETGANFSILASCWPTAKSKISGILNIPTNQIYQLDLLTRDEIVTVIKSARLIGPNNLIREIVNQAQGRPGLAVTLTSLCIQGGVQDVYYGEALQRTLTQILNTLAIKQRSQLILAAFSVGGDSGMSIETVANILGTSILEVWEVVTLLDDSGIIYDNRQNQISVQPATLREVLIRNIFFKGKSPIPIDYLFDRVSNYKEATQALIGAKARGAEIPEIFLIKALKLAQSNKLWGALASLGKNELLWVLDNHKHRSIDIIKSALHYAPEQIIPYLFEKALNDTRPLHSNSNHPLRIIQKWIKSARPDSGQAVIRRKTLLTLAQNWINKQGNHTIAIKVFGFSMFPGFEFTSTDPGNGYSLTIHSGLLSIEEIKEITNLWDQILDSLNKIIIEDWRPIQELIENWAYPYRVSLGHASINEDSYQYLRFFASHMLKDIVSLAVKELGILQWASRLAEHLEIEIDISLDQDYQILYPIEDTENWQPFNDQQATMVKNLAVQWHQKSPSSVTERLAFIESKAQQANAYDARWTPHLCMEISKIVQLTIPWVQACLIAKVASDLVAPFLIKSVNFNEPEWEKYLEICINDPNYRIIAIKLILRLNNPPSHLWLKTFEWLPEYCDSIKALCFSNSISESTLRKLLQHENPNVAVAAAHGEWFNEPKCTIRDSLREVWRTAALKSTQKAYWLKNVFPNDALFAQEWIENILTNDDFFYSKHDGTVNAAIQVLDQKMKINLLKQMKIDDYRSDLIAQFIGNNLELYAELLKLEKLKQAHLMPLSSQPNHEWIQKALLAIRAGYEPDEIVKAVIKYGIYGGFEWSGNESDMWQEWVDSFEPLCSHENIQIQQIGLSGLNYAQKQKNTELKRERKEAIFGDPYSY